MTRFRKRYVLPPQGQDPPLRAEPNRQQQLPSDIKEVFLVSRSLYVWYQLVLRAIPVTEATDTGGTRVLLASGYDILRIQ